jgi:hypothetical protein
MCMNVFWTCLRQISASRDSINSGIPEREGSNETNEYCLKRLHYISYFIATALTWR